MTATATPLVFTDLRAASYVHEDVMTAGNISRYGYHYGPIPSQAPPGTNTFETTGWQNGRCKISRVQGGVCWFDMGGGMMCGRCFSDKTSLYRHMRNAHGLPLEQNPRGNITAAEKIEGTFALKRFVLEQRWRRASFLDEPGRSAVGDMINTFADELEDIAQLDPGFAAHFGTRFHRNAMAPSTPVRGFRTRGPAPPQNIIESPATPTPAERARAVGMGTASARRRLVFTPTQVENDGEEEDGTA